MFQAVVSISFMGLALLAVERVRFPAGENLPRLRILAEQRWLYEHYRSNMRPGMANPLSRITAQGQISVPAEVRRKLGVGPGSVLEWIEEDGAFRLRRAGKHSWADIRAALFPEGAPREPVDTKDAIRKYVRKKHARR
ncbi:MAG: AbrB/MazE/SpoVT family DNA-binding domain-containing protein [Steroidobacteraceae bacterium]